jgi:diketogulonate reductase-like aldo/keto reductase
VKTFRCTRRRLLGWLGGAATFGFTGTMAQPVTPLLVRKAAAAGATLPVVGVGTWQTFDVARNAPERAELKEVLRALVQAGGSVVDSSPMYGRAEGVVGDLATARGLRSSLFLATKVWTRGAQAGSAQMHDSLRLLRTQRIDLMQVHNLVDWRTHLRTLKDWQADGRIRHLGITHYHSGAYPELMAVMRTREFAFVQLNYSMAEREAVRELLPLALDLGMGVIVNRPFSQGDLFPRVKGKPLPAWAVERDCRTWAPVFLRWILGPPAVPCALAGTPVFEHGAHTGALPGRLVRAGR